MSYETLNDRLHREASEHPCVTWHVYCKSEGQVPDVCLECLERQLFRLKEFIAELKGGSVDGSKNEKA